MLTFLYILFSVWLILSIVLRKRKPFLDSRFFVEIGILVYYALTGIRSVQTNWFDYYSVYKNKYGYSWQGTYWVFFCILIYYIFFLIGNSFIIHAKKNRYNTKQIEKYSLIIPNEEYVVKRVSLIVIIISTFLFLLYSLLFGGIKELYLNITNIRGGIVQTSTGTFDFLNKLFRVAPFSFYIIANFKNSSISLRYKLFIAILSGLIIISYGGRGILLTFLLIIFLGDYINKKDVLNEKYNYAKAVKIVLAVLFCLVLYRPLLTAINGLRTDGWAGVLDSFRNILKNSSRYNASSVSGLLSSLYQSTDHYMISLETAIKHVDNGDYHCRYFLEWFYDIINVLPSKLLGISKVETITHANSTFISGVVNKAQIPAGTIGEAYYTGGIFFVGLYGLIIGQLGLRLDNWYKMIKRTVTFAPTYYIAILFVYFGYAIGGDFASHISKDFTTILLIIILNKKMKKVPNAPA